MPRKARPPVAAVNTEDAARYVGLAKSTLEKMRLYGRAGPPFATLSDSAIRYKLSDLDAWLSARTDRAVHDRKARLRRAADEAKRRPPGDGNAKA